VKRWEYSFHVVGPYNSSYPEGWKRDCAELDKFGSEGWEAISVVPIADSDGGGLQHCWYFRKVLVLDSGSGGAR
jgi:hypothetical protein